MRILHLAHWLQGGAGRIIVDLATAQRRAGRDVTVVVAALSAPGSDTYRGHADDLSRLGVAVHVVGSTFERDPRANLDVVARIDRLFPTGHEPAVIHTHGAVPTLIARAFADDRRRDIVLLQTIHRWDVMKSPGQQAREAEILAQVDRVVVPSPYTRAHLIGLGVAGERIALVPYGVASWGPEHEIADLSGPRDRSLLQRMREWHRDGTVVLACIGTIGRRKNQRLLVEAVTRLPMPLRLRCVFIGDGDPAGLGRAIARSGRAEVFELHGYTPAARRIAAEADALVLPSRSEGQPLSVLEAFADSTLVIASGIPELAELVEDGVTGLRFLADDPQSLAHAIVRLAVLSPGRRGAMALQGRRAHVQRFSLDRMVRAYALLYEDLRREHAAAARPSEPPAACHDVGR